MSNSTAPRFTVRDALLGQSTDLIPRSDHRRRNRWQIIDAAATGDPVYDEFASKRAATGTARDLNQGLYGPLAETGGGA